MASTLTNQREKIDLPTWPRRQVFEHFRNFTEPYHSVCVRVDCTESHRFAKDNGVSVFLTMVHRSLAAAHQVENLHLRIVGEDVWRYEQIHAGCAVGRENETIGFAHFPYMPGVLDFVHSGSLAVEAVKQRSDLERYPDQNLIRFSVLPWLDFTSLSHARNYNRPDSAPFVTFGKITETDYRRTMPVSIHVHHALCDGSHLGQFVERLQYLLEHPEL